MHRRWGYREPATSVLLRAQSEAGSLETREGRDGESCGVGYSGRGLASAGWALSKFDSA